MEDGYFTKGTLRKMGVGRSSEVYPEASFRGLSVAKGKSSWGTMVLKLKHAPESPGGSLKTDCWILLSGLRVQ